MEICNFYPSKFLDPLNSIRDLKNVKRFCSVARVKTPSAYRGRAGGAAEASGREWPWTGLHGKHTHLRGGRGAGESNAAQLLGQQA